MLTDIWDRGHFYRKNALGTLVFRGTECISAGFCTRSPNVLKTNRSKFKKKSPSQISRRAIDVPRTGIMFPECFFCNSCSFFSQGIEQQFHIRHIFTKVLFCQPFMLLVFLCSKSVPSFYISFIVYPYPKSEYWYLLKLPFGT